MKAENRHYLAMFFLQTSMMLGMTLIPFFIFDHLNGDALSVAIAYGVQSLALGVVCLVSAPFLTGVKNGLFWSIIGAFGFAFFYAISVVSPNTLTFFALTGLAMAFLALAWPAMQSWLGAQPDERLRTKSFSYLNIALGLGLVAGPIIAGVLYNMDFRLAFAGVFVLGIFSVLLIQWLPKEHEHFGIIKNVTANHNNNSKTDTKNESFVYVGWFTAVLAWGLIGMVRTLYPKQIEELVTVGQMVLFSHGMPLHVFGSGASVSPATLYSWMQSFLSAGFFIAALVMGRTICWQHRFWLIIMVQMITGASLWLLAISGSLIVILISHLVIGLFGGFTYLSAQCYSSTNFKLKHRRLAISQGLQSSGSFALPLVFAQFATWFGLLWPFKVTPILLIGMIALQLFLLNYGRRKLLDSVEPNPCENHITNTRELTKTLKIE